jgi:hypothetical protein
MLSSKTAKGTAFEMVWGMHVQRSLPTEPSDRKADGHVNRRDVSFRFPSWGRQEAHGLGWRFEHRSTTLPYRLFAGASWTSLSIEHLKRDASTGPHLDVSRSQVPSER